MKVALVGASGNAGWRILAELSRRGHPVMAIALVDELEDPRHLRARFTVGYSAC